MEINVVMLLTLGGLGICFIIIGFILGSMHRKKVNRCTSQTQGNIVKYSYISPGFAPIAKYVVNNKEYSVKRKFRGIITVKKPSIFSKDSDAYVSKNDYLHIKTGAVTNMRAIAENLYPMDSSITVYYNPDKPKEAFLEKLPKKISLLLLIFVVTGILFILVGFSIFIIAA